MSDVAAALQRVTSALPGGGEVREGQAQMAEAVAAAIDDERHLVVQAGTGTGKSLAYLVPAILSGQRVVIATATKALQDQLADKDLPFLQEHLGAEHPFEFAVLKGRSNYLCRQRMREVTGGDDQLELDDDVGALGKEIARLIEHGQDPESTGDRAALEFEPRPKAWSQVSVSAMECPGANKCPSGEDCFAERARQKANLADVIVVNTHLYATDLASGGYVLPDHDVVIFDEAHELEDVAASGLGIELTAGRFRNLARVAKTIDAPAADAVDGAGLLLENALAPYRGQRLPSDLGPQLSEVIALADERVRTLVSKTRTAQGADEARKARILQAGGHMVGDLAMLIEIREGDVAWVEGPPHAPVLKVAPIDVAAVLSDRLWDERRATVCTSATIPPNLVDRLGLPPDRTTTMDVGSPFPYQEHGLLYCAAHLPDPRTPAYEPAMHDELEALITAAQGRTLALFTSWRAMTAAADELRDRVPFEILTQSDLPKPALIRAFTEDESACLFATMGFWQGVDVPGRSLSLVVLDRIPFPRPDEPLMQARRDKAGPAAFRLVDLPRAATLLAQGAGRLIRSSLDKGVVAVLDPRLANKKAYRWDLLRALPPMPRTRDIEAVKTFLTDALELSPAS
jgi:ATP-dependent DNA helicase DinG